MSPSLKERYYSASLCRHADVCFGEFQAASPAAKQDPHLFCEPVASLPAMQGNNTKQNKSLLHEVSGVVTPIQA